MRDEESILAAIEANPDQEPMFLVYADLLADRGHPRAELIRAQHDLASAPFGPRVDGLRRRITNLFEDHRDDLLGALTDFETPRDRDPASAFTWRLGFIDEARFSFDYRRYASLPAHYEVDRRFRNEVGLRALATHPSGRFCRRIEIGRSTTAQGEEYGPTLEALHQYAPLCLRELAFDAPGAHLPLGSLESSKRKLRTLTITATSVNLGTLNLPFLRALTLQVADVTCRFGQLDLPRLAELTMTAPQDEAITFALRPRRLTALTITESQRLDTVIERLIASEQLARLKYLSLGGVLSADASALLARHGKAFAHLESFALQLGFSNENLRGLHRVIPNFWVNGARPL